MTEVERVARALAEKQGLDPEALVGVPQIVYYLGGTQPLSVITNPRPLWTHLMWLADAFIDGLGVGPAGAVEDVPPVLSPDQAWRLERGFVDGE